MNDKTKVLKNALVKLNEHIFDGDIEAGTSCTIFKSDKPSASAVIDYAENGKVTIKLNNAEDWAN